jgi:hypothetical protein
MLERRRDPLSGLAREGLIRGISEGLRRLWAHVPDEHLPGNIARLIGKLDKRRSDGPGGARSAAEKEASSRRPGTPPR